MARIFGFNYRDIPFWWQFDAVLIGEERSLGRVMLNAMIDFSQCNRYICDVGGSEGTIPWKLYSSHENGTRTRLVAPINQISSEIDSEFDKRCAFFDQVIKSKNVSELVILKEPTSFVGGFQPAYASMMDNFLGGYNMLDEKLD
jgi:hypothetical protein